MFGMTSAPAADSSNTINSDGLNTDMPRRSLLTALSTTSNLIPRPQNFTPLGSAATGTMSTLLPTACKASLNTSDILELWRAYYLAMSQDGGASPLGPETQTNGHGLFTGQNLYTGSQFNQPIYDAIGGTTGDESATGLGTLSSAISYQHPQRMMRSSLRIPANAAGSNVFMGANATYLPSTEMVKIRSAIAAANTVQMRDVASGIGTLSATGTVETLDVPVTIPNVGAATAHVYGVTQQPYITEVYANTSIVANASPAPAVGPPTAGMTNNEPYVAIELYNPYPTDMDISGLVLVSLDRSPTSNANRNPQTIYTFPAGSKIHGIQKTGSNPSYQGGYALIENFGDSGVTYRPPSSKLPPTAAATTMVRTGNAATGILPLDVFSMVPLEKAIGGADTTDATNTLGKELVLARVYNGAYIPLDSFDFTGLVIGTAGTASTAGSADTWHYVRGNQLDTTPTGSAFDKLNGLWRFIYPGRYDASDPTPYAATAYSGTVPTPTNPTANPPANPPTNIPFKPFSRRQQGVEAAHWDPSSTSPGKNQDPFEGGAINNIGTVVPVTLGPLPDGSNNTPAYNDNYGASYLNTFPFIYLNTNEPGPNPTRVAGVATPVNAAPFGAFSRNSDLLKVPFVGSYTITPAANTALYIEMNAITMDCSFAEDTDVNDDPRPQSDATIASVSNDTRNGGPFTTDEEIGHFAPIDTVTTGVQGSLEQVSDGDPTLIYTLATDPYLPYEAIISSSGTQDFWRYRWASRVFDYLTVQSPNNDYFPNVNPTNYPSVAPVPVINSYAASSAGSGILHTEDSVPVYGKININTAPWRVMAALSFCPYDDADTTTVSVGPIAAPYTLYRNRQFIYDTSNPITPLFRLRTTAEMSLVTPDNVSLAKAIVDWRDRVGTPAAQQTALAVNGYQFDHVKGPFTSLTDLLNVPAVQTYINSVNFATNGTEPDVSFGHLAPGGLNAVNNSITDGVRNDVEERYDFLDRIGNQATVRSDTFTVYIIVQGWRNAGSTSASAPPQLVTQRRAAFFVDRSSVNPTNTEPRVYPIPQD